MKSIIVRCFLLITVVWVGSVSAQENAQRKPLGAIDIDSFTSQMQVVVSDNASMTQAWWIPAEFWGSAFMRSNPGLAEEAMGQLANNGILAVVQADITPLAGFVFYESEDVKKRLSVRFKSYENEPVPLSHSQAVSDSVQMLLNVLSPMFANTMGELGKNMHLYVMDNKKGKHKIVDPYKAGQVEIILAKTKTTAERRLMIDLPVDALFEPRFCPNGKPAHISWQYCPWSGKKL